jgi:hypothetical protein
MPKSYTQSDATINHFLRNTAQTPAATIYVGLFTTIPSGPGDAGTEASGGSYARQAVTFGAPTNGVSTNSGAVAFPTATASWSTINGVGLFSALSGGTLLYYGSLTTPKLVDVDDTASFASAALQITEQ